MVHWTIYPVLGTMIALFAWFSYYYLRWARAMDRVNMDHFEFQKQGGWIEGVHYWVALPEPEPEGVLGASRFPVNEETS